MTSASFTWATRREGNSGFVLESHPDGSEIEFGPMPAHVVPSFVAARRRYVYYRMTQVGFEPSLPETNIEPDIFN